MEGSVQICPACGKQNPEDARFCYSCGTAFPAPAQTEPLYTDPDPTEPLQPVSLSPAVAETQIPEAPYAQTQPQHAQPTSQAAHPPVYPPAYPQQAFPPVKRTKRGRVRCCAIGCLVLLLVLLIGLPILHVTVLRPMIEREIYKQVHRSLKDVGGNGNMYYGTDSERITERELNAQAEDAWDYIPGSSDGYIDLTQDQIQIEVKVYGVKVWAAADIRVNQDREFLVKSLKMSWLLHALFSEDALKREIAGIANEKVLRQKGIDLFAFQVTDNMLFIYYDIGLK